MRIALLSDVYKPLINGVVHHVSLLKKHLTSLGQEVWLIVPGSKDADDDAKRTVHIPGIPIANTGYHVGIPIDSRLNSLLESCDIIHVHHPFVSGFIGLQYAHRHHVPLVFTNHTRYDLYARNYLSLLPNKVSDSALSSFFGFFSQRCSALIAPSQSVADVMRRDWGVQGRIVVIPNGVELERFAHPAPVDVRARLGLPAQAVVGVFVGRMSSEKSVDRLLRVYRAVAHEECASHLLLVGGGPELESYRALADEMGVGGRVHFAGSVPYEQIPGYMDSADFFVTASVSEVHPLTLIEAAAAGLPIVGVKSPGVSDMVQDGVSGLLAEDDDLSFGLRLLRMITAPAESRRAMGESGRARSQEMTAESNARRVLELYGELTAG